MEDTGSVYDSLLDEALAGQGFGVTRSQIESSWRVAIKALFPHFARNDFSKEQAQFWEMIWEVEEPTHPLPIGLFLPRGHAKSTSAEMATVALGAMGRRHFAVYCCASQERANEHVANNIRSMFESPAFQLHYPEVGKPAVGLHGNRQGWKQSQLICGNKFTVRALGFDGAMRGIRVEGYRPDLIILDDIDEITDSPEMVAKKIQVLTKSIIPAKATNCLIIFAQNLIHPNSVANKVAKRDADFLRKIRRIGPVKAIEDFTYEIDTGTGDVKFLTGTATWPAGMSLEVCDAMINAEMGLSAFLTECQQEVDQVAAGAIFPQWSPMHHVITHSEFVRYYGDQAWDPKLGQFKMPDNFTYALGHDWGSTLKHPAVATLWARPGESRDPRFDPLLDSVFKLHELVAPLDNEERAKMTAKYFGNRILEEVLPRDYADNPTRLRYATMSHESSSERTVYRRELDVPIPFTSTQGCGATGGLAQLAAHYDIDWSKPHPFRYYPENYPGMDPETGESLAGKPLMGRPRAYWVVADGEGELEWDPEIEILRVKAARTQAGMKRGRWEIGIYHWQTTVMGTELQKPFALDEDAMCADRYCAWMYFANAKRLSTSEQAWKQVITDHPILENPAQFAGEISQEKIEMLHRSQQFMLDAERSRLQTQAGLQGNFRLHRGRR